MRITDYKPCKCRPLLNKVIQLGEACGLGTVEEAINNYLFHILQLEVIDEIPQKEQQLKKEAESLGIQFCPKCGAAMLDGECYMCRRIQTPE